MVHRMMSCYSPYRSPKSPIFLLGPDAKQISVVTVFSDSLSLKEFFNFNFSTLKFIMSSGVTIKGDFLKIFICKRVLLHL